MHFLFSKNMDPHLSKTVPGIPLRPLNHFLHIFEVRSILVKIVIFAIFDLQKFFHQTLKIDLEVAATFPGRFWKAQGPYFPSPNSDLKFGHFCNPNGNHAFFDQNVHIWPIIPFWVLKGVKIVILLMQILFSKNMDLQLSKTVPIIPLRPLVIILWFLEVPQKCQKKGWGD